MFGERLFLLSFAYPVLAAAHTLGHIFANEPRSRGDRDRDLGLASVASPLEDKARRWVHYFDLVFQDIKAEQLANPRF